MFIVMIATECAPVVKAGGLADVIYGLSRELEMRGNSVEIVLPKYDCMRYDQICGLTVSYHDLWVPWYGGSIRCTVWFGFVHGRRCFFIEPHSDDNFFNRHIYYGAHDDPMRFAFFSKAALEFLLKSGKRPDVIHAHDWHTGLLPVMLYEIYQKHGLHNQRVCYTVHNFKHQGQTGAEILYATGLNRPEYYLHHDRLRDNSNGSAINCMKGGIVYSNFVTTVSPQHAWEAKFTDMNNGLGHTLHTHQGKFGGVLNGVDYNVWNPEIDPHIPSRYTTATIENKYHNKEALRNRLWLRHGYKPLIAYVGRLDSQKGVDLIRHALFFSIWNNAQFVLLGSSPDRKINDYFCHLKHHLNDNQDCHLEIGFNEELSHLIYAGADMIVVPSNFEPCGLTQMIGMKYGTVPIVRAVGGLRDTVFDKDHHHSKPLHERNGFVFDNPDNSGIESALHRAIRLWYDYPDHFRELMFHGMNYNFSWQYPADHYLNIYNHIRYN